MANVCIVTPPHYLSETFIRAHEDRLGGEKYILIGKYPSYEFEGHHIATQFNRHNRYRRYLKLLPQIIYEKYQNRITPKYAIATKSLYEFFESRKIDVILAEYGMTGADMVPIAQHMNIPLVVHFHGHDAYHRQYLKDYHLRLQAMFDYATSLISVSQSMSEQLIRLGAPKDKIELNPYGPREYFYEVQPNYGDQVIAIGRFVETKAPYLTLSAFYSVLEECPDAKLVMVGDGDLREACQNLAEAWGISDRLDFPGALDHTLTRALMAESCCFVQHSIQDMNGVCEGTPVAILEAGASALPVVATQHAGIRQSVLHEKTGFLVPEKDIRGMSHYIVRLLKDKDLCRDMGAEARKFIRDNYNIDTHIESLQRIVDDAANS